MTREPWEWVFKDHSHGILILLATHKITFKLTETWKYYFNKIEEHQRVNNTPWEMENIYTEFENLRPNLLIIRCADR